MLHRLIQRAAQASCDRLASSFTASLNLDGRRGPIAQLAHWHLAAGWAWVAVVAAFAEQATAERDQRRRDRR